MGGKCSSESSGQKKLQNVLAGHVMKVMVAVTDFALWLFLSGVHKPMDFDIDIGNNNETFSSPWRQKAYISAN